jgi:hypothetical protein
MVEDHRGKSGYIDGRPTKIEDIGPLPAGWTATPPEPTPLEVQRQAESESLRRLAELDAQSTRSLRAIEVLTDMGDDGTAASLADEKSWLTDIEEQARTERVVLAAIRAKIAGLVGE